MNQIKFSEQHKQNMSAAHKGKKHSEATRQKISDVMKGRPKLSIREDKNHNWRGDNVSYSGLHYWVRRHLSKPDLCQNCGLISPRDLANITGIYDREFENWKYLCAKCHKIFDRSIDMSNRTCFNCGSNSTYINKRSGKPEWRYSKLTRKLLCVKCNMKEFRIKKLERSQ